MDEGAHHGGKGDGSYVIAASFVLAAIIVSASVIFAFNGVNSNLQQISSGMAEIKTGISNIKASAASPGGVQLQPAATPKPAQAPPAAPQPGGKISLADAASKGSNKANIVLVEYSDFQCPFCRKYYMDTSQQLLKDYVDSGKVRFVYKHFPLDQIHPGARPAAQGFECARDQGREWEFHDALFDEQQKLGSGTVNLDVAMIKKVAAGITGMDATKFNACLDSGEKDALVDAQLQEGVQNGITGTPGFLITDAEGNVLQQITGAQPYAAFQQAFSSAGA